MPPKYRIHPAIGVARLGNSPDEFYLSPEAPGALPIECDAAGNPVLAPDGTEQPVATFKDGEGRVKRQAARFQVYVYDDESPEGRPLQIGRDQVGGGGNQGLLFDIEWRVWLANKKPSWYAFKQLEGEHGYAPGHAKRNPDVKGKQARRHLIIDPGPRTVNRRNARTAEFDRDGGALYATTFPPKLQPNPIDTLGALKTDDEGRLLVLGGHGNAGSFNYGKFGQPRIDHYANNDGWFDDTSDGPVMARLVMKSPEAEGALRYVDVEYPAWVVAGYPGYVPEILDMVTMDDLIQDLNIRQFAARTDIYGQSGTFNKPQRIDPQDQAALQMWRAGRLQWNPEYKPWFFRDIWTILFRPDQFSYVSDILGQSNFPHNQSTRGTFDPDKLGLPPIINWDGVREEEKRFVERLRTGDLFMETLRPVLGVIEKQAQVELAGVGGGGERAMRAQIDGLLTGAAAEALRASVAAYVASLEPAAAEGGAARPDPETAPDALAGAGTAARPGPKAVGGDALASPGTHPPSASEPGGVDGFLFAFRQAGPRPELAQAREDLDRRTGALVDALPGPDAPGAPALRAESAAVRERGKKDLVAAALARMQTRLRKALQDHLNKLYSGRLLEEARKAAIATHTVDEYRPFRQFLFDLLRQSGEENRFFAGGKPDGRTHNLPLMPLLNGDNPLSNTLPSKFLCLTDTQLYLLRQWMEGRFYNEKIEGWGNPDPWNPYDDWKNTTGVQMDRGVISQVAGGAFCPGCELGWVMRNPAVYNNLGRIKADQDFYAFQQTAAQANATAAQSSEGTSEPEYGAYISKSLSLKNNFDRGLQPGDLTKYMALPWQADFNECSTNVTDITYLDWNLVYPESDGDSQMTASQRTWESLWWPGHRPMQVFVPVDIKDGKPKYYYWQTWALGIPQTKEGDFKMVTDWWRLGFVIKNPWLASDDMSGNISPPPSPPPYISVEGEPSHLKKEE